MTVRSTPTAADAMLERKKILDENALHIQTRDTTLREIAQWQPVLADIRTEIAALTDGTDTVLQVHQLLSTKLMEQRDSLQRQVDEKTARLNDLDVAERTRSKEAETADKALATVQARITILKAEAATHENLTRAAKEEHEANKARIASEIAPLRNDLEQARNHLAGVKIEEEVLLNNRMAEDARLARKGTDLAIYENRMRKFAAAAGMDPDKIIV